MKERGVLIRKDLKQAIEFRLPRLSKAFDQVFDDLEVEGSDGIGRKTEAPWVRMFSRTMSPNPREGFYLVIHFAADGSGVFVTVGCGSTIWKNGDLRAVSDEELKRRTLWARSVILQKWKTIEPYGDEISLGAHAALPRTFEKATAIARRVPSDKLSSVDLDSVLFGAAERLGEIYLAQLNQRDVSQGEQDREAIVTLVRPLIAARRRQGFGLTAPERKEVELRAMELAFQYLVGKGYECTNLSSGNSFDLLATRDEKTLKIEVKGTTSDLCDSFLMTRNEVELHRSEKGNTGLILVSAIRLIRDPQGLRAEGGNLEAWLNWDINGWEAVPVAYQISRV